MPLTKDCAEYVASFVFGCTGLALGAFGVATAAAAAPLAIGGATLAGFWLAERQKHGPESERALSKIIARITDENRASIKRLKHEYGAKLSEAAALLGEHLPKCDMSRKQLARDATDTSAEPFPQAATDRVMTELAGKAPNVFGSGGNMIAISLAREVISAAFEAAIEDKAYFEKLEPHLLIEMARTEGEILAHVQGLEQTLRDEFREIQDKLDNLSAQMEAMEARLLAKLGPQPDLPNAAVLSLAERIVKAVGGDEALALAELERAVIVARELRQAGTSVANIDGFVADVIQRMAALNDEGAEEASDAAFEASLARFQADKADRAAREQAAETALYEAGIRQAYLLRDAAKVAAREEQKVALNAPGGEVFQALRAVRREYYETGLRMGTRLDLEIGVALAERCIEIAETPDLRAMAQNDLGIVLSVLGERGGPLGEGALERAVAAYEAALTVYTQAAAPADWAITQNNLGNVLRVLGERGGPLGEGALERSVAAYEVALTVRTKEAAPAQWAMTQNNLGTVLQVLGERGGPLGEGSLERAVAAFEAALTVYTQAAAPADWAMTQNNLGIVLQVLGQRGGPLGDGALERSVAAYEAALTVYTQAAAPADWAMTQNNLGTVLQVLGQRGGPLGEGSLERAVAAYEAALTVRTKAVAPAQWAMTQFNLALVYEAMAAAGDRPQARLQTGLEAVTGALEVYRAQAMGFYVENAERLEAWLREKLAGLPEG